MSYKQQLIDYVMNRPISKIRVQTYSDYRYPADKRFKGCGCPWTQAALYHLGLEGFSRQDVNHLKIARTLGCNSAMVRLSMYNFDSKYADECAKVTGKRRATPGTGLHIKAIQAAMSKVIEDMKYIIPDSIKQLA